MLFYNNDDDVWFVNISGGADCSLGNEESNTHYWKLSQGFEGIADTALTGRPSGLPNHHHCISLVAIELESVIAFLSLPTAVENAGKQRKQQTVQTRANLIRRTLCNLSVSQATRRTSQQTCLIDFPEGVKVKIIERKCHSPWICT